MAFIIQCKGGNVKTKSTASHKQRHSKAVDLLQLNHCILKPVVLLFQNKAAKTEDHVLLRPCFAKYKLEVSQRINLTLQK
ncbi:hypothetical protein VNO78_11491 [Psophocarpus tetragonolobus]|uniref:Uncharacterized protein n=1 Tax=Psophocarpus tetragonolobus TaxID=3891 RepID=A0AAN9SLV8_PSOTE